MTFTFLWIWLATEAVARGAVALPPSAPPFHAVVEDRSGTYFAAALPLSDTQYDAAQSVWVWAEGTPPRRYPIAAMPRDTDALMRELRKSVARNVEARVRGWSRPDDLAGMRAIVAPDEMWLTVPEDLLPSYPVTGKGVAVLPLQGRSRIRVLGKGFGSSWIRIPSPATVADVMLRRTSDAELTLRRSDGSPASRSFATVMIASRGHARPEQQAQFAGDSHGRLRMASLPEADVLTLVISGEGTAPQTVSGTPSELTRTLVLTAAGEIAGRFVDEEGAVLAGVRLEAEAWIAQDVPAIAGASGISDDKGQWTLRGLPRNRVVLRATKEGRATFRKEVSLDHGNVDLGTISLPRSPNVRFRVIDGDDRPIREALVKTDGGFSGKTGEDGIVTITGMSPMESVLLTATAPRFVKQTRTLTAPFPREGEIVLARAFSVTGRIVDDQDRPVPDAIVVATTGSKSQRMEASADGEFSFDISEGTEFDLRFESPTSGTHSRKEPEGREGELRDLGSIRLDVGGIVRGRVVDASGAPVAGARVWVIRPGTGGTAVSWVAGRVAQAMSGAEGDFELRGLATGPALLRVDATDFARSHRDVLVENDPVDVGSIEIDRGSTVTVAAIESEGVARLDLRGEWVDADMLTAPVVDGEAILRNVPAGDYRMTVLQGRAVTCERRVSVMRGEGASVRCPAPMEVMGRVMLGGSPASGGTLSWRQASGTDSLIDTTMAPMGARQERIYGLGVGTINVPVRGDGSYESRQLRPGEWLVSWRSSDGAVTSDRTVNVPEQTLANLVIEYAGGMIRGSVVDAQGQPVQGARVREIQGSLFAMAAPGGTFTITGILPGRHRLQASLGAKSSSVLDFEIVEGKPVSDITFVLEDKRRNELAISVLGAQGEPRPHAVVFVEAAGVVRTLTADAGGIATGAFPEGLPDGSRIVAFAANDWAFGRLRRSGGDEDSQTATIRFGATGRLRIKSGTKSGIPEIRSTDGGDLAWILSRVGFHHFLTPESPVEIQGLPPGAYEVSIESSNAIAMVSAGRETSIDLR